MQTNFHTVSKKAGRQSGFTFVEVMVASVLSVLVIGTLMVTTVFVSGNFRAMTNYEELDRYSRNALDYLNRDLRSAAAVTSFSSSSVTLTNSDGSSFSYQWDTNTTALTRTFYYTNGTVAVTVLLTNCDIFNFNFFQRNPSNHFTFYPATDAAEIKLVDVDWKCSRQIQGVKINTESIQTAQIAIRN